MKKRAAGGDAPVLTAGDINRATLARQMLLAREAITAPEAVARLVGLQAQWPAPPYVGLWTRLRSFTKRDLAQALEDHSLVRATSMRGTLHVLTADDYRRFRPLFEPMLAAGYQAVSRERGRGIEPAAVAAAAREFLTDDPRTMEEIRQHLAPLFPGTDVRMLGYAVRMHLPLVQVPEPAREWGFPTEPSFALADSWLKAKSAARSTDAGELARRYLAAFGPATPRDVQTWSGLGGWDDVFTKLRPKLALFQDEKGRELFDLPDAPRPGTDAAAPARFLPEYDNLLLAHHDRTRFVPQACRGGVFLPGLRVASTFLVDGQVRGAWKLERTKKSATLHLTAFAAVSKEDRAALAEEAGRLVSFLAPDATTGVRWVSKP